MSTTTRLRRIILNIAATRPGMGLFYLFVQLVDLPISRLTKGVFIPSANWNVMPIIYLTTTGAKVEFRARARCYVSRMARSYPGWLQLG